MSNTHGQRSPGGHVGAVAVLTPSRLPLPPGVRNPRAAGGPAPRAEPAGRPTDGAAGGRRRPASCHHAGWRRQAHPPAPAAPPCMQAVNLLHLPSASVGVSIGRARWAPADWVGRHFVCCCRRPMMQGTAQQAAGQCGRGCTWRPRVGRPDSTPPTPRQPPAVARQPAELRARSPGQQARADLTGQRLTFGLSVPTR